MRGNADSRVRWSCSAVARRWRSACFRDVVLVPQTAGSLTFLGSFFIVLLSPLFAWLWPWLERRGCESEQAGEERDRAVVRRPCRSCRCWRRRRRSAEPRWRACGGWCWPTSCSRSARCACRRSGLSAVTQLSVARVVGLMMGGFWLATAYSEVLAAQFGKLASIEIPEGGAIDVVDAAGQYARPVPADAVDRPRARRWCSWCSRRC